jgi:hypothetical protein
MQCAHDPLYDVDPLTGSTIEVFYADRRGSQILRAVGATIELWA